MRHGVTKLMCGLVEEIDGVLLSLPLAREAAVLLRVQQGGHLRAMARLRESDPSRSRSHFDAALAIERVLVVLRIGLGRELAAESSSPGLDPSCWDQGVA